MGDAPKVEPGALVVEPAPKAEAGKAAPKPEAGKAASKVEAGKSAPKGSASTPTVQPAARVKKTTDLVTSAESAVNAAVSSAKKVSENEKATEPQIKGQVDNLTKQQTKLTEAQKAVNDDISEIRKAGPSGLSHISELQKLSPKIKTMQSSVNTELTKVKSRLSKIK